MGEKLFDDVTDATGLPRELISGELERLLSSAGVAKSEMTLDDLRRVLSDYLQEVLLATKDEVARASGE